MMVDGEVRGVLGVAKPTAYDFSSDETELLMAAGSLLANS